MGIIDKWQTKIWMESSHWSLKQLVGLFVVNCLILLFTFPLGITFCFSVFVWDLLTRNKKTKEGHGQKKKISIIGAGVSGITSAVCLTEEGHEVEIFEKDHTWGGVWQFSKAKRTDDEGFAGQVWQELITTSSAYVTSFSAFPPQHESVESKEHPFHMTASMYYDYLTAYMRQGGVDEKKVFRFNHTVKTMKRVGEKWELTVEHEGKQKTVESDWVILSTGQHQVQKTEHFDGLSDFKGAIVHSSDYVNPKPYAGKRVLIIGGGDSGADIVKHVSEVCAPGECYMSLRRGAHVAPRYFHKDPLPIDYAMFRMAYYMPHLFRTNILRRQFRSKMYRVINHEKCETSRQIMRLHHMNGLSASTYFTTKSEGMCDAFANGKAHLKPEVEKFTATGCDFRKSAKSEEFGVDTKSVELDAVILCTGFTTKFPMLPADVQDHDHLDRYRLVHHPDLPNVGFVGFVRPTGFGAIPPCAEMQARWIAQVVSGKVDLPSREEMRKHAAAQKKAYLKVRQTPNQMLVFFTYYLCELAHEIDANPNMVKYFFSDFTLWYKIMFGAFTSHQFRLNGPHAKHAVARDIICNKATFPDDVKELVGGPVSRPPKLAIAAIALMGGVMSKIPVLGRPFARCI